MKLTKLLDLLARPTGFEPLTLGLEMRGFVVTNCIELYRFGYSTIIILQDVYENGLKTHSSKLQDWTMTEP